MEKTAMQQLIEKQKGIIEDLKKKEIMHAPRVLQNLERKWINDEIYFLEHWIAEAEKLQDTVERDQLIEAVMDGMKYHNHPEYALDYYTSKHGTDAK